MHFRWEPQGAGRAVFVATDGLVVVGPSTEKIHHTGRILPERVRFGLKPAHEWIGGDTKGQIIEYLFRVGTAAMLNMAPAAR